MKWVEKLVTGRFRPLRAVEWIVSVCTLIGGVYVFTPIYRLSAQANGPGIIAQAVASPYLVLLFAAFLIIGSVLVIIGLRQLKPQLKSAGWFIIMLTRFFQILTTWLTMGLLPITWIYPFTLLLIIFILWCSARVEVYRA